MQLVSGFAPKTPTIEGGNIEKTQSSDIEKNHLQRQAANAGLKMEPFIRKLIMGVNISPRPPSNIVNLIREVNRIGNNINQIAKKVNSEYCINQAQLDEILHLLGEIYREVKN